MASDHPEPGGRDPAPGALRLVQEFVNSCDRESGEEAFRDPESLRAWFEERELVEPGSLVGEAELRLVVQLREAIRDLALANHEGAASAPAVETLNRLSRGLRLTVRFDEDGRAFLEPMAPGVDGAMAQILGIVYSSIVAGTWPRFKACRRDSCRWAFYDRSKNLSSSWCSMKVCGNREKAKAFRMRRDPSGSRAKGR